MRGKVFVVLPKPHAYVYKGLAEKAMFKSNVLNWVNRIKEATGLEVHGFAEDVLLAELLPDSNTIYASGNADYSFAERMMRDELPGRYFRRAGTDYESVSEEIVRRNCDKVKTPDRHKCFDSIEYNTKRANTFYSRLRFICNEHLSTEKLVIYFASKGNNYCNGVKESLTPGDGKIYIEVDPVTNKADIMFSGIRVNEDELFKLLGGL